MAFFAQEYSRALGRTITYEDISVTQWRDGLIARGFALHLVDHLATIADLHRAGRYDRMSDDVFTLTGRRPISVQDVIRNNSATFAGRARVFRQQGR